MIESEQQQDLRRFPPLVVLTGFRATGKTAVGRILAELLGYRFIDTDEVISSRLGCSIAESVRLHGWQPFRDLEQAVLQEFAGKQRAVLATGGGAVLHGKEWQQLRSHSVVIWLQADVATILSRLQADRKTAQQRPALSGQRLELEIPALLKEREPLYRAGSDITVATEKRGPAQLAEIIVQQIAMDSAR